MDFGIKTPKPGKRGLVPECLGAWISVPRTRGIYNARHDWTVITCLFHRNGKTSTLETDQHLVDVQFLVSHISKPTKRPPQDSKRAASSPLPTYSLARCYLAYVYLQNHVVMLAGMDRPPSISSQSTAARWSSVIDRTDCPLPTALRRCCSVHTSS